MNRHRVYMIWREGHGVSGLHEATAIIEKSDADERVKELNAREQKRVDDGYVGNPLYKFIVIPAVLDGDLTKLEEV